jgi:hypothetical protein
MNVPGLRSPYDTVGGIVHFGRMLDKIRLNAAGTLPADYQENLGGGFDGRCCAFLQVKYERVVASVKLGGTDEGVLQSCFDHGRKPSDEEIEVWNSYMSKRGWNDAASERLAERVKQLDPQWAGKIHTFFDFIEVDEGRPPRCR